MTYQKEAARKKLEEKNRLLNMIQDQTYKQYELLSSYMKKLEQTESREEYDMLLSKIVVVGTYLKRRKNLPAPKKISRLNNFALNFYYP